MNISPVSSAASPASAAVLLASASVLPDNTAVAAIADTPSQIRSQISELQQDEVAPASGQSRGQIQQDLLQLQQAQKQQSSASAEPMPQLNAKA
jgi:ribosomal protein RSM22 (predicted rRNA methylase)